MPFHNTDDFLLQNVMVHDLQNIGALGSTLCGEYESNDDGGHRKQLWPLQRGYTGTEVRALAIVSSSGKMDGIHIRFDLTFCLKILRFFLKKLCEVTYLPTISENLVIFKDFESFEILLKWECLIQNELQSIL